MNHLSSVLAVTWIASMWQGCALALLAAAFLRLVPQASAAVRHTVLLFVFALTLLLPFVHVTARGGVAPHAAVNLAWWFAAAISVVWIAASVTRAVSLVLAWKHLRAVRRTAQPITIEDVQSFTTGTRRAVLCASSQVDTPAVLGFFQPVLLLPTWLVPTLSAEELRQLALHECEHLRRHDDWINLGLQLGLVLMPLNPALVWLNRRIGVQRELACDDAVVASTAMPLAYAASLTRMAEQRMQKHSLRLALAAWGRRSELALRVHALLRQPAAKWSSRQSALALSAAAVLLMAVSTGLVRAPRFVRVADAVTPAVTVVAPVSAIARTAPVPSAPMLVPVSYQSKPGVTTHHKASHPQLAPAVTHTRAPQPRFLRTALNKPDSSTDDLVYPQDRPVRFVTTEFIQPYVAVPVANGWLLIEL